MRIVLSKEDLTFIRDCLHVIDAYPECYLAYFKDDISDTSNAEGVQARLDEIYSIIEPRLSE